MFSIKIPRCNSPRPDTRKLSGLSVSATRSATLCTNSLSKRSRILRDVTNLPSLPQNGELFTENVIVTVGSSTLSGGNASTLLGQQIVSEILSSPKPVTVTMLPA